MRLDRTTLVKFGVFTGVMVLITGCLFAVFSNYRSGPTDSYSAVFADASRLKAGDTVRAAGIRVGTVREVSLQQDKRVLVRFDVDRSVALTVATKAAVRYLNLVGDRYLDLIDSPGSAQTLVPRSQIPLDRTMPALNLDLLLGGLKPVVQGLNPQDINALSASLLQVLQGQGDALQSLFSHTSSFTNALADNSQAVELVIDNLNDVLATLSKDGTKFSDMVDALQKLVSALSKDRDPIGMAVESLDQGTASIADLLAKTRPPLAGTVRELNRLAPLLDGDKDRLDATLQKLPDDYRKLVRLGSYGSWINYYVCGLSFRATDLQGRSVVFPWIKQETGRCAEP